MLLPPGGTSPLEPRQTTPPPTTSSGSSSSGGRTFMIVAIGIIVGIAIPLIVWLAIRRCLLQWRQSQANAPKPRIGFLRFVWQRFANGKRNNTGYDDSLQHTRDRAHSDAPSSILPSAARTSSTTLEQENELSSLGNSAASRERSSNTMSGAGRTTSGVDRNTSVRSVMTLPPYRFTPNEDERILGREGERAGVDVVIEYPETNEEEEARREEEMEGLYQIRVARRGEQSVREEQRRLRREARDRGDWETLTALRQQARERAEAASSGARVSDQLIAEHQGRDRTRRVSSVQYAEVGVARHDGTRIRANSTDSDNRPLLDAAGHIAGTGDTRSLRTLTPYHSRGPSASSVLSLSSMASDDYDRRTPLPSGASARGASPMPSPGLTPVTSNGNGGSNRSSPNGLADFEVINLSQTHSHSRSRSRGSSFSQSIHHDAADLGEARIPLADPPQYEQLETGWEEAPPYSSPLATRRPELPLPAVNVSTAGSGAQRSGQRDSSGSESGAGSSPVVVEHAASSTAGSVGSGRSPPVLPMLAPLPAIQVTAMTPVEERTDASFREPR